MNKATALILAAACVLASYHAEARGSHGSHSHGRTCCYRNTGTRDATYRERQAVHDGYVTVYTRHIMGTPHTRRARGH